MRKKSYRLLALLLIMATVVLIPVTAQAATNWKTGGFSGGTSWTTTHYVYAEAKKNWLPFGGTFYTAKTPTLTFYSYSGNGKEKKGTTMYVQILRWNGNTHKWTCEYDYRVKNGEKIKLKLAYPKKQNDYSGSEYVHYWNKWAIRIRRNSKNTDVKWWGIKADNGTFSY